MAKDTFYFSHDYSARNDPKLVKVLMRLGQAGKGVYWDLIEMLYEQEGYLLINEIEAYAFALRSDCDTINSLINDFELFDKNKKNFWSLSVLRRLDARDAKSKKASESANKRWNKANAYKEDANALQTQYDSNAIKERKGKESKVKERKGKKRKDNSTEVKTSSVDYKKFVDKFNSFANRSFRVTDKIKSALNARLKDYDKKEIISAIEKAHKDEFHISSNFKYLTPEFILRPDKLEKFLNQQSNGTQKTKSAIGAGNHSDGRSEGGLKL